MLSVILASCGVVIGLFVIIMNIRVTRQRRALRVLQASQTVMVYAGRGTMTYTIPPGVNSVNVTAFGGTAAGGGGGGGGSSYAYGVNVSGAGYPGALTPGGYITLYQGNGFWEASRMDEDGLVPIPNFERGTDG